MKIIYNKNIFKSGDKNALIWFLFYLILYESKGFTSTWCRKSQGSRRLKRTKRKVPKCILIIYAVLEYEVYCGYFNFFSCRQNY